MLPSTMLCKALSNDRKNHLNSTLTSSKCQKASFSTLVDARSLPMQFLKQWSAKFHFVQYDCSTPLTPRYFEQDIHNSFPDLDARINFLNKFHCLCGSKTPHKIRKLVLIGPCDSGKTVWGNVLCQIIPDDHIASVTNEGQFSSLHSRRFIFWMFWCG